MKIENKEKFPIRLLDLKDETYQGRLSYDEEKVKNLAQDIEKFGQREPIGIKEKEEEKYQILYGFQRIKALLMLGRDIIKATIYKDLTDREYRELCIRDNEMHGDLTIIERALQCKKLKKEGWSMDQLCQTFNTKKSAIYNWLEATKLDDVIQGLIHEDYISIYQGLELGKEKDFSRRLEIIKDCLTRDWSVRNIKTWINEGSSPTRMLALDGWIELCPDGPSYKPLYECRKCKYHVKIIQRDKDHKTLICDGWDKIKHTLGIKRFFVAYIKAFPQRIWDDKKEESEKLKKLEVRELRDFEGSSFDRLQREGKEPARPLDYLLKYGLPEEKQKIE